MSKLKNIWYKLKAWYRGENVPLSLEQILNSVKQGRRHLEEKQPNVSDLLKPPLIARTITSLWRFWSRNWKWLLGFMATLIGLFIGYLKL